MLETLGRYSIREQVSSGDRGTTTVYRAFDEDRERQVALKVLVPELLVDLDQELIQTRLRRAAEGSSFLNHAAIARVRDVGFADGLHFVSTDFVEGSSAFDLVAEHGPMPLPEALRLVMDVLAGLGYAHSQGIVHQDVKLENVMLRRDGSAVLTDFGSLRDFSPEGGDLEERWASSITSLSPEQILGEEAGPASDLYGVGVVLFEVLTGDSAFPVREGEDPWEAARRRVELPPPRIPFREADLPKELDEFFARALARDPQSRFESASDMTRALIALAVRYRLDIPDAVPLETIPDRYQGSREALRLALHAQGGGVQFPVEPIGEMEENTRRGLLRRRQQGWMATLVCLVIIFAGWYLLLSRLAYLSVSSFPPGAQVILETPGVEEGSGERVLGVTPISFYAVPARSAKLRLVWPANPPKILDLDLEGLEARAHLQVNASPETSLVRRIRIRLPRWLEALLEVGAGEASPGPLELRSLSVDAEADRLLLDRQLMKAAAIYRERVQADSRLRRQAADRMVEVAYLRQGSDLVWAIEAAREAVRLDEDHGRGHTLLGEMLHRSGDPEALFHLHKGAQRLASGTPSGLDEDPVTALAELRQRLEEHPEDPLLRRWECHLLRQSGAPDESLQCYLKLARERGWNRPSQY